MRKGFIRLDGTKKRLEYLSFNRKMIIPFFNIPEYLSWKINLQGNYNHFRVHKCRICQKLYFCLGKKEHFFTVKKQPDNLVYQKCSRCFDSYDTINDEYKINLNLQKRLSAITGIGFAFGTYSIRHIVDFEINQYKLNQKNKPQIKQRSNNHVK